MRPSQDVGNQLNKIMKGKGVAPVRGGIHGAVMNVPNAFYFGLAGLRAGSKLLRDGTTLTNPMYFRNVHSGYGKRGIDGDNLGTDGLVGGLHSKRRKS